jgi:hypothetical protein
MGTRAVRAGSTLVLAAGLLAGCQTTPRRPPYADNPLLQTRQPLLQSQAGGDRLNQIAQSGPQTVVPPPNLAAPIPTAPVAVSSTPPDSRPTFTPVSNTTPGAFPPPDSGPQLPDPNAVTAAPPAPQPVPLPARMPSPSDEAAAAPLPAAAVAGPTPSAPVPAVATATPAAAAPVAQVSSRRVNGKYGNSSDHTWLQGELDRHYRGHLELRYQPASEEDTFGGKVRLENDPRLAEFRAGDIVAVEGELIRDSDGEAQPWSQYPRYHIRAIRLIERK